jgi:hypothetical protein
MRLTTWTVQIMDPPPPFPEPLHWFTLVTSVFAVVTPFTVELLSPVARSRVLVTDTEQSTARPGVLLTESHCEKVVSAAAAEAVPDRSAPPARTRPATSMSAAATMRPPLITDLGRTAREVDGALSLSVTGFLVGLGGRFSALNSCCRRV